MPASDLHMDVRPYGDGRVLLTLGSLSLTLEADAADKLAELLQRAAMPGQEGRRGGGEAGAAAMAIDHDGTLRPVSEFTREVRRDKPFKWWCDGEDCDGGDLPGTPHVHPMYGPARRVDLLTGRSDG